MAGREYVYHRLWVAHLIRAFFGAAPITTASCAQAGSPRLKSPIHSFDQDEQKKETNVSVAMLLPLTLPVVQILPPPRLFSCTCVRSFAFAFAFMPAKGFT
jgi:hypothetical protein